MTFTVPRSVQIVSRQNNGQRSVTDPQSLADFRNAHSYILLGDPGLGKTVAFQEEAKQPHCCFVTARQLLSGEPNHPPLRQRKTLFIDGLDEMRMGDPRAALDNIVRKLRKLGKPSFRLSCRAGDWFGSIDERALTDVGSTSTGQAPLILALTPLSENDVRQILKHNHPHTADYALNPDQFISEARECELDFFLWNPLLLRILVKSVAADGWPTSPSDVWKVATKSLAEESNEEHRGVSFGRSPPQLRPVPTTQVLNAAGLLSALLLISGKDGWTYADTNAPDILSLRQVDETLETPNNLQCALASGLFTGTLTSRTLVHRRVGEYLGARFLNLRMGDRHGPSIRRVLSLILGSDGKPLPDLRGLAAWLATLNREAWPTLMRADPLMVAFAGDTSTLDNDRRIELLENLLHCSDLHCIWPTDTVCGALAGSHGLEAIAFVADRTNSSVTTHNLLQILLRGFARRFRQRRGAITADIEEQRRAKEKLLGIVNDTLWAVEVRRESLLALHTVTLDSPDHATGLLKLIQSLDEVNALSLTDERNVLRGTLLDLLYPATIRPTQVWNYLLGSREESSPSTFDTFWKGLAARSSDKQIVELLNSLCIRKAEITRALVEHKLETLVPKLLLRGLDSLETLADVPKLHQWLGLVEANHERPGLLVAYSGKRRRRPLDNDDTHEIYGWLSAHPKVQLELIERSLEAVVAGNERIIPDLPVGRKLIGEEAPEGFRRRCLARATELWSGKPSVARELARWAVLESKGWGQPVGSDDIARAARNAPTMLDWYNARLAAKKSDANEEKIRSAEHRRIRNELLQKELVPILKQKKELAAGLGSPALLDQLANIYFGGLINDTAEHQPRTELRRWLNNDEALLQAVLAGFNAVLERNDLPNLKQIADLHQKKMRSLYDLPFLAGMEETEWTGGEPLKRLDHTGIRRALGFYLVSDLPSKRRSPKTPWKTEDLRPPWFKRALALGTYREAVADALVAVHRARIASKQPPDHAVFDMSSDPAYQNVTYLAVKRILSTFPTRCSGVQLEWLRAVLWAALGKTGIPDAELQTLVLQRIKRKGMDLGQRAQWLCAGMFVARDTCLPEMKDFLKTNNTRLRHVAHFFAIGNSSHRMITLDEWCASELAQFIQIIGKRLHRHTYPQQARFLTGETCDDLFLERWMKSWIKSLSARITNEARSALKTLCTDEALDAWSKEITSARESQAAEYQATRARANSLEGIQGTLRNRSPASAADLVAITVDTLERLGKQIRHGSTNDWITYWH